jgi:hypothetical protein
VIAYIVAVSIRAVSIAGSFRIFNPLWSCNRNKVALPVGLNSGLSCRR